jgi:hypothetical protein
LNGEEVTPFLELACQFFSDKNRISMEKKVNHSSDLQRMFYCPIDLKPNPKPTKQYLRYTATKLFEAGLEFEADFSKTSLLDIEFSEEKCLESYPGFNLSWLFSFLPRLKSFPCTESVQCRGVQAERL